MTIKDLDEHQLKDVNILSDQIREALGLETDLARTMVPHLVVNLMLLERKQKDYGPANLTKFGAFGIVVRANDKMERLVNLLSRKVDGNSSEALNESTSDTFLDLANYGMIGYLIDSGLWGVRKEGTKP